MVSFEVSRRDSRILAEIARRAYALDRQYNAEDARTLADWRMDFTAVHANGNPLRLEALASADEFNFVHDAFGIARHLDRSTGKLTGFFSPRFSTPERVAA